MASRTITALALLTLVSAQQQTIPGVTDSWPYQTYKSTNLTIPAWNVTKTGKTESGYIFYGQVDSLNLRASPGILEDNGELIWRPLHDELANDVRPQVLDGETYLTYIHLYDIPPGGGWGWGDVRFLDASYEEKYRVTLGGPGSGLNFKASSGKEYPSYVDTHESQMTDDGTILVTAVNVTQADLSSMGGPKEGWINDGQFYEIDPRTNKIMFSWSMYDNLDQVLMEWCLQPLLGEGTNSTNPWGYAHLNSVAKYGDHYLLNSRYMCRVFWINKHGEVEWTIQGRSGGNFTMEPGTEFCYEHDVRIQSMTGSTWTISMHNNMNTEQDAGTKVTTGLFLDVHFDNMTVALNKRMWNSAAPVFSVSQGSFQPLANGHSLQAHGASPTVEEYDENGALVMAAVFGINTIQTSYRVYRDLWTGSPTTKPDVVACETGGKLAVFVSWNGATDITGWKVNSGNGTASVVPRDGFETRIELDGGVKSVSVEAVGGHLAGTKSETVTVDDSC